MTIKIKKMAINALILLTVTKISLLNLLSDELVLQNLPVCVKILVLLVDFETGFRNISVACFQEAYNSLQV